MESGIGLAVLFLGAQLTTLTTDQSETGLNGQFWPDKELRLIVGFDPSNPQTLGERSLVNAARAFNGVSGLVVSLVRQANPPDACDLLDQIPAITADELYCGGGWPNNVLAYTVWSYVNFVEFYDVGLTFNLNQEWGVDGNGYDPEPVMIHEIGHAVGLGHVETYASVMTPNYEDNWRRLQPRDIENLITLYGPPPEPEPSETPWLPAVNDLILSRSGHEEGSRDPSSPINRGTGYAHQTML